VRRELAQYGSSTHTLSGAERVDDLFGWACAVADSASIVLFGLPVVANCGRKVRRKLVPKIRELGLSLEGAEFWSITQWIGTASRARFMLRLSGDRQRLHHLALAAGSVFWAYRGWEDMVLYRQDRLVYWCTAHEREGAVFGSDRELSGAGLRPVPSNERWTVEGELFDEEHTRALLSEIEQGAS
jgi:hypothetical protein